MEHNRITSNIALHMVSAKQSYNNLSIYNNINSNIPVNFAISPNSGSISSQNITTHNKQPNMMKIIRGGNGTSKNNFFISKMLNSGNNNFDSKECTNEHKKVNLNELKKKKNEEIKIYENDNLNNSNGSEIIDIQNNLIKPNTTRKEKGGILGFFSKLMPK